MNISKIQKNLENDGFTIVFDSDLKITEIKKNDFCACYSHQKNTLFAPHITECMHTVSYHGTKKYKYNTLEEALCAVVTIEYDYLSFINQK